MTSPIGSHVYYVRPAETLIGIRLDGDEDTRTHDADRQHGNPLVVSHLSVIVRPITGEEAPGLEVRVHGFHGDHRGETVYATHPAAGSGQYQLRFAPGFVNTALREHAPGASKVAALNGSPLPRIEGLQG
jgi:hypothetical protein